MIDPRQIPDEVVKAALSAYKYASSDVYTTEEHDMAEAIAAAINAWPGAWTPSRYDLSEFLDTIILPLPQEPRS